MTEPEQRRGAVAAAPPGRRRPWWLWLLLAAVVVVAILLLATQCGGSSAPQSAPAGAPAAPGAPGGPPAPGAPGAPPAPGAPGGPPAPGAPGAPAPGAAGAGTPPAGGPSVPAGAGGAGGAASSGDVAGVSARVQQIVEAQPITFRPDRPELTAAGAQTVDEVARELTAVPAAKVTVVGYAAPVSRGIGPAAQGLSDQRAAAVAQRLAAAGIGADRVQARGAADTDPLPSTAASRRATITVS